MQLKEHMHSTLMKVGKEHKDVHKRELSNAHAYVWPK